MRFRRAVGTFQIRSSATFGRPPFGRAEAESQNCLEFRLNLSCTEVRVAEEVGVLEKKKEKGKEKGRKWAEMFRIFFAKKIAEEFQTSCNVVNLGQLRN